MTGLFTDFLKSNEEILVEISNESYSAEEKQQAGTLLNAKGTSKTSPKCPNCGPWIKHWENVELGKRGKCSKKGCSNDATDGAHVRKADGSSQKRYIIPLCGSCNVSVKTPFNTKAGTKLAWANVSETCGKKTNKESKSDRN